MIKKIYLFLVELYVRLLLKVCDKKTFIKVFNKSSKVIGRIDKIMGV